MSEERKFEISEDILRALKIRRASVEADSETSQLMGDTEKTDRKRLCSAAAEEYEKGNTLADGSRIRRRLCATLSCRMLRRGTRRSAR